MATGTAGSGSISSSSAASTSAAYPADRERYIESQLRRTRRQVRGVELVSRLMLLCAAAIALFLVAAVVDHWLVPGGLGVYGRLAFLALFLVGAGVFVAREIAPLFIYRISPVYAAHTIERAKPTLKNSLVNFLLLRSNRAAVPDVVLSAVEEQAATNLSHTPIEHVVDRTRLVQIGYVLLAMVAAFALYYLASPKSPLQTLGRVVLPWADLQPASRVKLDDIEPGTTTKFRGEPVTIAASVEGLDDDEPVMLYFTTADQQAVDQPVRMYSKEGYRFTAVLPPDMSPAGNPGLQQDVEYRIEAGDAVSRTYRLSVIQAPNIVVERLDYAYPEYTRLARETIERTGDVKAVEGTEVTIHALANQPIKSAWLELGGGGQNTQLIIVDGQRATGTITLALNEQRTGPRFSHYLIRFVTPEGHENPEPIRYRIEVTPDPSPELQLLRPDKVEMPVPLDVPVQFELHANDPLYGLADVKLVANVGERTAFRRNWSIARGDKSATRFVQKHAEPLNRVKLDDGRPLKPGDVIEYWAEAVDNKTPNANVTKSNVRKLIVVEPQKRPNPNDQPQQNEQDQGQGGENRQQEDGQDQNNGRPNERNDNNDAAKNDQRQPGDNQQQPSENQSQPGDNNQKRDGSERNPNDAKNEQQKQNNRGQAGDDQQPMNDAGESKAKNDQNQKGKSGDASNDKKDGKGDQQKTDGQKGGKGASGSNDRDNATGDNQSKETSERGSKSDSSRGARDNAGQQNQPQDESQQPVDKSDEGEAFDRILKHAQEKDGKSPESNEGTEKQPSGNTKGKDDSAEDQQKNDADKTGSEKTQNNSDKSGAQNKGAQNKGTEKRDNDATKDDSTKTGQPQPENQATDKSGDAQSHQDKQGSPGAEKSGGSTPPPQERARPKNDKQPGSARGAAEQKEQSQGQGKKDSDTQGEESGDRRGDGKAGGGQSKNQAGKGAKGSSDPSDEGGKAASEEGKGDTGKEAGDDQKADGNTGKSGTEKGDGSKTRPGTAGGEKGDESKEAQPSPADAKRNDPKNAAAKQQPNDGAKSDKSNEKSDTGESKEQPSEQPSSKDGKAGEGGNKKADSRDASTEGKDGGTGGGGTDRTESGEPPDLPRVDPTDDDANLEYSRRATDLALDHLRNQLKDGRPDQELLDRLGWSREDLQKLLARWEKMEREAKQPGPRSAKAKDNLQEALRSLGWKRPDHAKRAASKADDAARGLRDANRSAPPPEYSEGFRAFQRSTSRAE